MGKVSLAIKLADELGTSVGKATRFIDEVGVRPARSALDDVATKGSETVAKWWKPTAVGGGLIGGGTLAWRQQDVRQAEAIAQQEQAYSDAVLAILESDMSPQAKRELLDQLRDGSNGDGGDGGDGDDSDGLLPDDAQTTLILLVVAIFAMKFALDGMDGGVALAR